MGKNAFCIEHELNDTRVAVLVDCEEAQQSDWLSSYAQQKGIERVGWKCLRVDALSIFVHYNAVVRDVIRFLALHGIDQTAFIEKKDESQKNIVDNEALENDESLKLKNLEVIEVDNDDDESMVETSEEEGRIAVNDEIDSIAPDVTKSLGVLEDDDNIEAWKFGEVVDLDFLRVRAKNSDVSYELSSTTDDDSLNGSRMVNDPIDSQDNNSSRMQSSDSHSGSDVDVKRIAHNTESVDENTKAKNGRTYKSRKRKRMYKHSRDESWCPATEHSESDDDWFETDFDIRNSNVQNAKNLVADVEKQKHAY